MTLQEELDHAIHQANLALKEERWADARRGLLKAVRAIEKAEANKGAKVHAHALN